MAGAGNTRFHVVGVPDPPLPMSEVRTYFFHAFGCQMNRADAVIVEQGLARHGWIPAEAEAAAQLILFHTCSVRQQAEDRVHGRLDALRRRKLQDPNLKIVVLGCMAQRLGASLLTRHPHLDLVLGTRHFPLLADYLDDPALVPDGVAVDPDHDPEVPFRPAKGETGVDASIPVMRGCDQRCAYCIVPSTRGDEISRPLEAILEDCRRALDAGARQITLLGQTIDAYGRKEGKNLAGLLEQVHDLPGLERLRFVTSHPLYIDDILLDTMARLPRLMRLLHVPPQSGSDRILGLMRRGYTASRYLEMVAAARSRMPDVAIMADFICGFPSETEEDHQATLALMRQVNFQCSFIFRYSTRPGTPAADLPDDVHSDVKYRRVHELQALQLSQQQEANTQRIGQTMEVLVEGPSKNKPSNLQGRSFTNDNVVFPKMDAEDLIGQIVPVRITSATNLTLTGERVEM